MLYNKKHLRDWAKGPALVLWVSGHPGKMDFLSIVRSWTDVISLYRPKTFFYFLDGGPASCHVCEVGNLTWPTYPHQLNGAVSLYKTVHAVATLKAYEDGSKSWGTNQAKLYYCTYKYIFYIKNDCLFLLLTF